MVGISFPGTEVSTIESAGIQHIPVDMSRRLSPGADLVSLWHLYRIIRRERFTIVHTHTPKPGLLGQLAARMAGVPIVVNTLHGFYFHERMHPAWRQFYISMERIAASCSDVILSQNREAIQTAVRHKICSADKIRFLGNGIDLKRFDPSGISGSSVENKRDEIGLPKGNLVIGFVGRLTAAKGFLDFLLAGKNILQLLPNVRLMIIGESDVEKRDAVNSSIAEEYGVDHRCLFLRQRPNEELPLLYSLMDVLVLPSLYEGFPRVVMEASAMAVPVVVTDVKGNREAVLHKRNGLLVPWGDVSALSAAIYGILTNMPNKQRGWEVKVAL